MSSQAVSFPNCSATCPRVAELEERNEELEEKLAVKEEQVERLRNKLRRYENPHTSSRQKRGTTKSGSGSGSGGGGSGGEESGDTENEKDEGDGSSQERLGGEGRGRKEGHEGTTREKPEPDRTEVVVEDRCENCGRELGDPDRTETRVIEDIPDPGSVETVEYEIGHWKCECGEETVATHEDIPEKGDFGHNVLVQTTLLKFQERASYGRIQKFFKEVHGLELSTGSLHSFVKRVADQLRPFYEEVREEVRKSEVVYGDETGISLDGEQGWVWTAATDEEVLYAVREDRSQEALKSMLGENFPGTIVCDGWGSYIAYSSNLQRCWSHLHNESEFKADRYEEAVPIDEKLHKIFNDLNEFLEEDPPPEERDEKRRKVRGAMEKLTEGEFENEEVEELITYIENGMDYWLTFVTEPEVDPTNNRAERALRKIVTLQKIMGTVRSRDGRYILEAIMTAIETWKARGQNPHEEMQKALRNS